MKKIIKYIFVFVFMFSTVNVKAIDYQKAIETGKLILPGIPVEPEGPSDLTFYDMYLWLTNQDIRCNDGNSCVSIILDKTDKTKGVLRLYNIADSNVNKTYEDYNVNIEFDYDPNVKKAVDKIIEDIVKLDNTYILSDIESISYFYSQYLNGKIDISDVDNYPGTLKFSDEFKKTIGYNEFKMYMGAGYGEENLFQAEVGLIFFSYNNHFYGYAQKNENQNVNLDGQTQGIARKLIYINEEETDVKEAIKNRLSKFFEIENVDNYKISNENVDKHKYLEIIGKTYKLGGDFDHLCDDKTDYDCGVNAINNYSGYEYGKFIFDDNVDDNVYTVTFKNGFKINLLVAKDSSKVKDDVYVQTSDITTGVELVTNSPIPLDVLIKVAKITTGEEYDKIVKLLNNKNVEIFDINLYSPTNDTFIKKLDNGKFEIRLPIKEEFKGKDLIVYYINDNDETVEYKVTITNDGGFAIFETDHFSIYTLAVKKSNNPQTGDNLVLYMIMLAGSAYVLYKVKKYN